MSDLIETNSTTDKHINILVIDDDPVIHKLIIPAAKMLGYTCESAYNVEEAMLAIKEAEENKNPFSVATIDMKFKGQEMPIGRMILQRIKSQFSYIACIIISGSGVTPHEVLDLRDEYGLDYYISKDRLDPKTLDRGIGKAMNRVRPLGTKEKRRKVLEETLERYKDVYAIHAHNLAIVEMKKAQKGIDVSVDIENQIAAYKIQLEETEEKVQAITEEIKQLSAD